MGLTHRKGSLWRRKVCAWLEARGLPAEFRSIGVEGDDVTTKVGKVDFSIEAKNHRAHDFSTWLNQAEANAPEGHIPVVMAHRRGRSTVDGGYVFMTGAAFSTLLRILGEVD